MEFLVKNGSERVIDDARSHLSLLKMLRQFHYIDQNGKDQGINVRNRSKELTDLLSDVDRIRQERKKARATKNKYGGVEGGAGLGSGMSGSSQYGGFGSEEGGAPPGAYGGFSGGVYGDGGGFGGNTEDDYDAGAGTGSSSRRDRFEEYDEYDEGASAATSRRKQDVSRTTSSSTKRTNKKQPELPKPKEPEVDLFDFGDDEPATIPAKPSNGNAAPAGGLLQSSGVDDDDFDDFQSATPSTQTAQAPPLAAPSTGLASIAPPTMTPSALPNMQFAAPQPRQGTQIADFSSLLSTTSPAPSASATPIAASAFSPPAQTQAPRPTGYQPSGPNYYTSVSLQQSQPAAGVRSPGSGIASPTGSGIGSKPKSSGGDAFASLLGGAGLKSKTPTTQTRTMADMAKEKASAGIWGTTGSSASTTPTPSMSSSRAGQKTGGAMNDLLG